MREDANEKIFLACVCVHWHLKINLKLFTKTRSHRFTKTLNSFVLELPWNNLKASLLNTKTIKMNSCIYSYNIKTFYLGLPFKFDNISFNLGVVKLSKIKQKLL